MTDQNAPIEDPRGFIAHPSGALPGEPIAMPIDEQMTLAIMGMSRVGLLDMSDPGDSDKQARKDYASPLNMRTEVWMAVGDKRAPFAIVSEVGGKYSSTQMFLRAEFDAIGHVLEAHDEFADEQDATTNQKS